MHLYLCVLPLEIHAWLITLNSRGEGWQLYMYICIIYMYIYLYIYIYPLIYNLKFFGTM